VGVLFIGKHFFFTCENVMCEFNIILDGQKVFNDVIYAKVEGNTIKVKNILGCSQQYQNVKITEIDVTTTRLVLETIKT
jgi:predicted RNA-binding protein